VISSDSNDGEGSEEGFVNLESSNPLVRIITLGKMQRALNFYVQSKLERLDIRLLKGFYVANDDELEVSRQDSLDQSAKKKIQNKLMSMSKFQENLRKSLKDEKV